MPVSPKTGCRSSYGARKLPKRTVPHEPCRPRNVSRPAIVPPPASPETDDSICQMALRPPPRASVPRRPKRDELLDRRATLGVSSPILTRRRRVDVLKVQVQAAVKHDVGGLRLRHQRRGQQAGDGDGDELLVHEVSPLTDKIGRNAVLPRHRSLLREVEKLQPLCQRRLGGRKHKPGRVPPAGLACCSGTTRRPVKRAFGARHPGRGKVSNMMINNDNMPRVARQAAIRAVRAHGSRWPRPDVGIRATRHDPERISARRAARSPRLACTGSRAHA